MALKSRKRKLEAEKSVIIKKERRAKQREHQSHYSVFKASGLTLTAARKQFGFDGMQERSKHVQECNQEAQDIREAVDKLAHVQNKALLMTMGFPTLSSSESETETDSEINILFSPQPALLSPLSQHSSLPSVSIALSPSASAPVSPSASIPLSPSASIPLG